MVLNRNRRPQGRTDTFNQQERERETSSIEGERLKTKKNAKFLPLVHFLHKYHVDEAPSSFFFKNNLPELLVPQIEHDEFSLVLVLHPHASQVHRLVAGGADASAAPDPPSPCGGGGSSGGGG